jgi:hypothetical protein
VAPLAVDQYQDLIGRQPAQRGRPGMVGPIGDGGAGKVERRGQRLDDLGCFGTAGLLDLCRSQHVHRHRGFRRGPLRGPGTHHGELFESQGFTPQLKIQSALLAFCKLQRIALDAIADEGDPDLVRARADLQPVASILPRAGRLSRTGDEYPGTTDGLAAGLVCNRSGQSGSGLGRELDGEEAEQNGKGKRETP